MTEHILIIEQTHDLLFPFKHIMLLFCPSNERLPAYETTTYGRHDMNL